MGTLQEAWDRLKVWRQIRIGPVSLVYRFRRTVPVTRNLPRRAAGSSLGLGGSVAMLSPLSAAHFSKPATANLLPGPNERNGVAVIVGVGPGFGFALAKKLVAEGFHVALVSRQASHLADLALDLNSSQSPGWATVYSCDATDERGVREVFSLVVKELGVPALVVYSTQATVPGLSIDISTAAFEDCWRTNCLGAFIVAREAASLMRPHRRGSIILVGSTSGLIGRDGHLSLAVGKFGLRAVSQVMARELWKEGLHVAHLVIDADIDGPDKDPSACACDPSEVAEVVYSLHQQPKSAWASEIDLRPATERFWEHC